MPILNFDATQFEPSSYPDPLPPGKYLVEVTDSDLRPTKRGDGELLELEFTVMNGEFKGRKVWDRFCMEHPNQQTVEIARLSLATLSHAVGLPFIKDSIELYHRPVIARVKCKRSESDGEIYNEIKGYEKPKSHAGLQQPSDSINRSALPHSPTPTDNNSAPWARS